MHKPAAWTAGTLPRKRLKSPFPIAAMNTTAIRFLPTCKGCKKSGWLTVVHSHAVLVPKVDSFGHDGIRVLLRYLEVLEIVLAPHDMGNT